MSERDRDTDDLEPPKRRERDGTWANLKLVGLVASLLMVPVGGAFLSAFTELKVHAVEIERKAESSDVQQVQQQVLLLQASVREVQGAQNSTERRSADQYADVIRRLDVLCARLGARCER